MKIIDIEKVLDEQWKVSTQVSDKFENLGTLISNIIGVESGRCFGLGVNFAETELQNLAIEFASFIGDHHYRYNQNMLFWFSDRSKYTLTTSELFTKFITERNK